MNNLYDLPSPRRDELAIACGSSPDYFWQIARGGQRRASPSLARLIEQKSRELWGDAGTITKEAVRPDIWEPA